MNKSPPKPDDAPSGRAQGNFRSLKERISGLAATLGSTSSVKTRQRAPSHSVRRINALARQLCATRYLEIGVHRGETFLAIEAARKTAVDRHLQFEWSSRQTDLVRFYEMTSDKWFLTHADGEVFDIIFLDGLHTFEQTFRDFCNSLLVSHNKTVWVIDDTMPGDIYSACPNHKLAAELRRNETDRSASDKRLGGWSGDVFKMVFAIHDFFPMLSYRTILSPGNPQTIVWRQPRSDFVPVFNNLEAISRISYFEFKQRPEVFQGGKEKDILQALFGSSGLKTIAPTIASASTG